MKLGIALSMAAFVAACATIDPPEQGSVSNTPWSTASSPDQCDAACARLGQLACPEGMPSPGGHSCVEVCVGAVDILPVSCVAGATTIQAVRACGVRCLQ